MRKIVSQIAGAVAVVTAATFAFAQTNDSNNLAGENRSAQQRTSKIDSNTANGTDLKSSETGSRFGPGGNNGSTYNAAIRSTDIKAGNVSSVEDPVPAAAVTAAPVVAPAPVVTATPEPAPVVEPAAPAVVATPEPTPAPAITEPAPEPMRPARADRN